LPHMCTAVHGLVVAVVAGYCMPTKVESQTRFLPVAWISLRSVDTPLQAPAQQAVSILETPADRGELNERKKARTAGRKSQQVCAERY
jgi:hypothetical protein